LPGNREAVRSAIRAGGGSVADIIAACLQSGLAITGHDARIQLRALKEQGECKLVEGKGWLPIPGPAPAVVRVPAAEEIAISQSEGKHEAEEVAAAERDAASTRANNAAFWKQPEPRVAKGRKQGGDVKSDLFRAPEAQSPGQTSEVESKGGGGIEEKQAVDLSDESGGAVGVPPTPNDLVSCLNLRILDLKRREDEIQKRMRELDEERDLLKVSETEIFQAKSHYLKVLELEIKWQKS
jgi:transposase-like protein